MTNYQIKGATIPEMDMVWSFVSEGLDKSCRRTGGDLTAPFLWAECRSGRAFLRVVVDPEQIGEVFGASVWRFEDWTSGRKLRCLAMYGRDMQGWISMLERDIRELLKTGGGKAVVFDGRDGWLKVFPGSRRIKQTYEIEP